MTDRKIPTPLIAAAGAGDIAVEQLRKLSAKVAEKAPEFEAKARKLTRDDLADLRDKVVTELAVIGGRASYQINRLRRRARKADPNTVIETVGRNAGTLVAVASGKAVETYAKLLARGEEVVAGRRAPGTPPRTKAEPAAEVTRVAAVVAEPAATAKPTATAKPAAPTTPAPTATKPVTAGNGNAPVARKTVKKAAETKPESTPVDSAATTRPVKRAPRKTASDK